MRDDVEKAQIAKEWLESDSKSEVDLLALEGLQQVTVPSKDLIRCDFVVPNHLSDKDGNWHVEAMMIMMDNIAGNTVFTSLGKLLPAISLDITLYSTAPTNEEVEIEGRMVGERAGTGLLSVEVKMKKKKNGEQIAIGKLWMGPAMPRGSITPDFAPKASLPSRL